LPIAHKTFRNGGSFEQVVRSPRNSLCQKEKKNLLKKKSPKNFSKEVGRIAENVGKPENTFHQFAEEKISS